MAGQPHPITAEQYPDTNLSSIVGPSHPGTTFYICDTEFTRILPQGEDGEVCIAGPQLGRGYATTICQKTPDT